jgi:hypothetical protein
MVAGQRIRKRGLGHLGTVERITPDGWVRIKWDEGKAARVRPLYCTRLELEEA